MSVDDKIFILIVIFSLLVSTLPDVIRTILYLTSTKIDARVVKKYSSEVTVNLLNIKRSPIQYYSYLVDFSINSKSYRESVLLRKSDLKNGSKVRIRVRSGKILNDLPVIRVVFLYSCILIVVIFATIVNNI